MNRKMVSIWNKRYRGDEVPPAGTASPPAPPPPAPPAPPEPTYKKADVEKMVQDRIRKANEEKEGLLVKLQDAVKTKEERDQVTAQLEEVRTQLKTKEEQAADAVKRAKSEREAELKLANEKAQRYKEKYERDAVQRSLLDAAVEHKAHRPQQLVDLLGGRARVAEKLDKEGKPTGEDEVRVKVNVTKDKKLVEMDLTPAEAIKAMKDDVANHGNLFASTMVGGIGSAGPTNGKPSELSDMDQASFNQAFREGKLPYKGKR